MIKKLELEIDPLGEKIKLNRSIFIFFSEGGGSFLMTIAMMFPYVECYFICDCASGTSMHQCLVMNGTVFIAHSKRLVCYPNDKCRTRSNFSLMCPVYDLFQGES